MSYIIGNDLAAEILIASKEIVNESFKNRDRVRNQLTTINDEVQKRTDALIDTYKKLFEVIGSLE